MRSYLLVAGMAGAVLAAGCGDNGQAEREPVPAVATTVRPPETPTTLRSIKQPVWARQALDLPAGQDLGASFDRFYSRYGYTAVAEFESDLTGADVAVYSDGPIQVDEPLLDEALFGFLEPDALNANSEERVAADILQGISRGNTLADKSLSIIIPSFYSCLSSGGDQPRYFPYSRDAMDGYSEYCNTAAETIETGDSNNADEVFIIAPVVDYDGWRDNGYDLPAGASTDQQTFRRLRHEGVHAVIEMGSVSDSAIAQEESLARLVQDAGLRRLGRAAAPVIISDIQ